MTAVDEMEKKIRETPGLYIGRPSLELLLTFLDGYATRDYEIFGERQDYYEKGAFSPKRFERFVYDYYGVEESPKGAAMIITEHCAGDDEKAFYKYFEFYDMFMASEINSAEDEPKL